MTTTPKLNVLLGVKDEPDLTHINERIAGLIRRLSHDPDPSFLITARSLHRTSKSIPAVAVITHYMFHDAIAAERIGDDELYILFLTTLFVLIIDDHFDTRLDPRIHSLEDVRAYSQRLLQATRRGDRGPARAAEDDACGARIIEYIVGVTERLRAYPTFAAYAEVYFQALTAMLDGMVQEFKNRDPRATNLDQYMTYAAHSVGTNLGLTASLVLLADATLTQRPQQLWMTFSIVAAIIRYSNDIRSYERELAEGKFSSLQLAAKKFGIALDEVNFNQHDILRIIRAMMIAEVYDLRDCLGYLQSQGGRFEIVVINTVLGVVCLYEQADFHTLVIDAARS